MSIGQLTKQIAQQAIGNQVREVVEGIVPETTSTPSVPEGPGSVMLGELNAMQKGMKDDQELVVTCCVGGETLRVREIYVPSWRVAVVSGAGADKALTRVICPFEALVLVCKPAAVAAGTAPMRVRIVTPKPSGS